MLVLVGPTAVGKTELSLKIAEALGTDIISGDSMCIYRGFDIGSAKPTAEEQARVTHHLVDILDADEAFSVTEFVTRVAALVQAHEALPSAGRDSTSRRSSRAMTSTRRRSTTAFAV